MSSPSRVITHSVFPLSRSTEQCVWTFNSPVFVGWAGVGSTERSSNAPLKAMGRFRAVTPRMIKVNPIQLEMVRVAMPETLGSYGVIPRSETAIQWVATAASITKALSLPFISARKLAN